MLEACMYQASCFFKPRHLRTAYSQDPGTTFCLPGGQMRDTNQRHEVEQTVLNREMNFYRDHVLADMVSAQKREKGGDNDDN